MAHEDGDVPTRFRDNTREVQHLGAEAYDACLAENIAFMDLWDTSANNALVECIVRATPVLVNPLPAVVEYLGADYPFYFSSLEEAAEKALDLDLVARTHRYLELSPTRRELTAGSFLAALRPPSAAVRIPGSARAR